MRPSLFKIWCFLFFLPFSLFLHAQNPWIDSLKKVTATPSADTNKIQSMIVLAEAYRFSHPDTCMLYAGQALALSEKLNYDEGILWSIVAISGSLYILGNYNKELEFTFKLLALSKKMNTTHSICYSKGMLSDCYYNLGEYDTAMHYWREVVTLAETSLKDELFQVYANSSHIFSGMQDYDSALIYAKKSYLQLEAKPWYNRDDYSSKWARSSLFECLGEAFAGKGNEDSAFYYFRTSVLLSRVIDMHLNEMDACIGMAKLFQLKNKTDSAIWYAKKAIIDEFAISYPVSMLKAANLLVSSYEAKKNPDSALKYLHMTTGLKDSLYNRGKTMAFQHILFTERDKQNQATVATAQLRSRYRMYFLIILLVALLATAGVIIVNKRRKQLQDIRNHIANDLHDDIGSALSSISIMSELAKVKSPEASALLNSISENTAVIQENMSDIVWTIKTDNDSFENMMRRMHLFATGITESKNMALEFTCDAPLAATRLTMQQRKNVYLFFKEAINNAAKYSAARKVSVCIRKKENQMEMNITDDGKGFDPAGVYDGNGMNSLRRRAAELRGEYEIISPPGAGTKVQLRFKMT
jgi:signal transduction histidine kinase